MSDVNGADRETVALAAFLHDIGKLLQRAGVQLQEPFDKNFWEQALCVRVQNYFTYRHALFTAYFIECFLPDPPGLNKDLIFHLASYHHRPHDDHWTDWVIVAADWIASGAERYDEIREEADFRNVRLHPVFALIGLNGRQPDPAHVQWDYPLKPLELKDDVLFPEPTRRADFTADFHALWQGSQGDLQRLPRNSFRSYFNGLFSLMYRYTWCVPSASNVYPDISLFDHSRVTAALAVCLYEFSKEIKEVKERLIRIRPDVLRRMDDWKPFLLVKGELSGIQSYIYRIARTGTGGIAKRLRGRSFYLQMFNHQVARLILDRLGLTLAHLIYCGGGSFLLLLPNTAPVQNTLQTFTEDIEEYLWEHHLGELKFRLADKPLAPKDIFDGLSQALQELELRLTQARYRHFRTLFQAGRAVEREKPWESIRPCRSCQIQVVEGADDLCDTCMTQQDRIGARLPHTEGAVFSSRTVSSSEVESEIDWKHLGRTYLGAIDQIYRGYAKSDTMEAVRWNAPESAPRASPLFVANVVPKADRDLPDVPTERDDEENPTGEVRAHQVFSFSTIARWSEGDARLGVLRMDADRMGAVIAQGLNHHGLMSFSRVATLSRQLQLFFEGWLRNICEACTQEWKKKVQEGRVTCDYADAVDSIFYVVYSGGDDLFIVGPWSEMLPLALRIRDDYRRFTCENPDMTLSAGLIVCKPKFPVPAMARLSGEAEDRSKRRGRNRITAFGTTVPWESHDGEWGLWELLELAERWTHWIRTGKVPRRFFHELLRLQAQAVSSVGPGMWIPRLIYRIYRNISDEAIAQELHHTLLGCSDSLALLRAVRIPASVALLKTRS